MATKNKIGTYTNDEGNVVVQMAGSKAELLELLSFLNAKYLLEVTDTPEEYQKVFNRLQVETGKNYSVLLLDKVTNKSQESEDFLGDKV
ncbi:Phage protein [Enterococcus phage 156]|nr:Phage protein [Enterococcus phage 156]VDB76989.1 Phage protein [Enterococcus phage 156]